ncbi:MAG: Cas9 endonuclease PAM-interacting domain-containing protein, partial [Clostridium sp.]
VAVVGSYVKRRFPSLDKEFIYEEYKEYRKEYNGKGKYGFILSSMFNDYIVDGEVIWNANEEIAKFKKVFDYNDAFVVRKTEINDGELFKVTRKKKPSDGILKNSKIPLKNNKNQILLPEKYGYYDGIEQSYYSIIEFTQKGKRNKRLVGVPIMFKESINGDREKLKQYFESIGYEDVEVIKEIIPKYQKIVYKGHEYYITSSNDWCNAKQLILPKDIYNSISILNNNKKWQSLKDEERTEYLIKIYNTLIEKIEEHYSVYEATLNKLKEKREKFISLSDKEQLLIINQILKLTKANSECANILLLKEKGDRGFKREGRIENKSNKDVSDMVFVYESHTGLIRKEVKY